jgi:hypothetical protein
VGAAIVAAPLAVLGKTALGDTAAGVGPAAGIAFAAALAAGAAGAAAATYLVPEADRSRPS